MKITHATYIDHQSEIQYPIAFLKQCNPRLIVFTNDDYKLGIPVWHGINIPGDISIAQNKCCQFLFDEGYDIVVWQQADIYITEIGKQRIKEFVEIGDLSACLALNMTDFKMFHHCGYGSYGVNVIGKKAWEHPNNHFTGDGGFLGHAGAASCYVRDSTINIGYLSIEQCRRHIRRHKITWSSNDPICEWSDEEFVKAFVARHNVNGMPGYDTIYYKLFVEMGLYDEFERVKVIMKS